MSVGGRLESFSLRKVLEHPLFPWALIGAWALVAWLLRPSEAVLDWMGWRQADTLAIARNFVERPSGLLFPRIDWGGSGPGFVEAELQLLPFTISLLFRVFGRHEWLAQLVSLACTSVTAGLLERFLRARYGALPALLGLLSWLTCRGVVFAATAVQPDLPSLLFSMLALVSFADYVDSGRTRPLVVLALSTALAAAIKPTALYLGVTEVAWLVLARPRLLKKPAPWLAWAFVLALSAALLLHARSIYLEFGNTFGILSGGDRKTPTLEQLAHPHLFVRVVGVSLRYGIGWFGAAAGLYLLLRKRWSPFEWALFAGNAVLVLVSFRYACNENYGSHYHLPTTLLGASFVAHAAAELPAAWRFPSRLALVPLCLAGYLVAVADHRQTIRTSNQDGAIVSGRVLRELVRPDGLVVVRSVSPAHESWWNVANNFQDPRTLYVAHTRGWVLPWDCECAAELEGAFEKKASYYVEWGEPRRRPAVDALLLRRAKLVWTRGKLGRIWQAH
jgi:hypothetical protein